MCILRTLRRTRGYIWKSRGPRPGNGIRGPLLHCARVAFVGVSSDGHPTVSPPDRAQREQDEGRHRATTSPHSAGQIGHCAPLDEQLRRLLYSCPTAHTVQVRTLYLHCSGRTAAVPVPLVRARGPYLRAPSTRGTGASLYLYLRYALECSFDMLIAIFCEPSHTLHALDENPST